MSSNRMFEIEVEAVKHHNRRAYYSHKIDKLVNDGDALMKWVGLN